jgi:CRISPR-associated protein Cas2
MVFFDLPTDTAEDRRNYSHFHKFLIREGFMMMQYSVYTKLAVNKTVAQQIHKHLQTNKPPKGHIAIMDITEKQFNHIQWLIGGKKDNLLDTADRLTIYDEE